MAAVNQAAVAARRGPLPYPAGPTAAPPAGHRGAAEVCELVAADDRGDDGDGMASAGLPDPISAPASSVMVPPGSSTAGTATISTTTATHSTLTVAAVGSALSADGKMEAAPGTGITRTP